MADQLTLRAMDIQTLDANERRGFLYACEMMSTWARQIEEKAPALRGADIDIPLSLQMENSARFTVGLATALSRQATR
ncbi:MAG: hypothetical protein ACJAVZ_000061 [Afipia broomeae]|jgi:hypothetical protein